MMLPINELLFSFSPNPYALYAFTLVGVSVFFLILIARANIENNFKQWLKGLYVTIIFVGIAEMFARMSTGYQGAMFWWSVYNTLTICIPVFILGWTMTLIGLGDLISGWKGYLLFLPALIVIYFAWVTDGLLLYDFSRAVGGFGGFQRVDGRYYSLFVVWLSSVHLISAILLLLKLLRTRDKTIQHQSQWFLLGFAITMILNIFGESIQETILGNVFIPSGIFYALPLVVVIGYIVIKYRVSYVNPATLIDNIVATISEVIFVINPNTYIIEYVTGATQKVLGYESNQIFNSNFKELVSDSWDEISEEAFKPILENDSLYASSDVEVRDVRGEMVPVKLSASPYKEEGVLHGIVIVATDLRETTELINTVAERNKLEVIQESIADGIIGIDFALNIVQLNTAAKHMLGVNDDILGQSVSSAFTLRKEDEDINLDRLLPHKDRGTDEVVERILDAILVTNSGEHPVNVVSSAIKEAHDVGLGAIITIHDLSAEHDLEKMKLDFVSMAAHELRTPLTSIRGYLDVFKMESWDKLTDQEQMIISRVDIAAQQLTGLMENLLSVTRIEKGTYNLNLERVDWVSTVAERIEAFQAQAADRNLELIWNPPTIEIPQVEVDPLRILEVLNNLVSNAIKYTPSGKITVSVEYDKENSEVITRVSDTGQGIPKEAIGHMFEKFFRVSGILEQGSKGTGLGLYIARAIIELHGGRIWVDSEGEGKGSTFSIALPVPESE